MGQSSSSPPPPPPQKEPSDADVPALERTLTPQALVAVSNAHARRAQQYERELVDAQEDLQLAMHEIDKQREELLWWGTAAAVGSAVVASAGCGLVASMTMRRNAAALAHLSQELVDVRRRGAAELAKAERFGGERLAKSLLPALDAIDAMCDRQTQRREAVAAGDAGATASVESAAADDEEGCRLTASLLHDALRKNGIDKVAPAVGDAFSVDTMEAMMTVPAGDAGLSAGLVASVLRPGYVMHGGERCLRPAQVGVASKDE